MANQYHRPSDFDSSRVTAVRRLQTALNVALPALQAVRGAGGADLLWIVNAYALCLAAATIAPQPRAGP